jgi:hypothetical protein
MIGRTRSLIQSGGGFVGGGGLFSRPSGFNPLSLPGLAAWYDASDSQTVLTQVTNAASFNGSSQRLSSASNTSLQLGDVDFSFSFLCRPASASSCTIVGKATSANRELYIGYTSGERFFVEVGNGTGTSVISFQSSGVHPHSNWYHIYVQYASATQRASISIQNAALQLSAVASSAPGVSTSDFTIGSTGNPSGFFPGQVAMCGFWKRLLTTDERTFLFNSGFGRLHGDLPDNLKTSLVSYWNLTESSGTRNDNHGTNHLTDNAGVTSATGPYATFATDGQTVRRWLDKSGNARHLDQTTLAQQPTLTGGVVTFTGSQSLPSTFSSLQDAVTILAVFQRTGSATNAFGNITTLLGGTTVAKGLGARWEMAWSNTNFLTQKRDEDNTNVGITVARNDNINVLVLAGDATNLTQFLNLANSSTTHTKAGLTSASNWIVGNGSLASAGMVGTLREMVFYTQMHSNESIERLVRYAGQKWGISL